MAVNATITFESGIEFDFDINLRPIDSVERRYVRNNTRHKLLGGKDYTQLLGVGAAEITLSGTYYRGLAQVTDPFVLLRGEMDKGTPVSLSIYGTELTNLLIVRYEDTGQDFYSTVPQTLEWSITLREQGTFTPSTVTQVTRFSPPKITLINLTQPSGLVLDGSTGFNALTWDAVPDADFYTVRLTTSLSDVGVFTATTNRWAVPSAYIWVGNEEREVKAQVVAESNKTNVLSSPASERVSVFFPRIANASMTFDSGSEKVFVGLFQGGLDLLDVPKNTLAIELRTADGRTFFGFGIEPPKSDRYEMEFAALTDATSLVDAYIIFRVGKALLFRVNEV